VKDIGKKLAALTIALVMTGGLTVFTSGPAEAALNCGQSSIRDGVRTQEWVNWRTNTTYTRIAPFGVSGRAVLARYYQGQVRYYYGPYVGNAVGDSAYPDLIDQSRVTNSNGTFSGNYWNQRYVSGNKTLNKLVGTLCPSYLA
jgi:hypothetical protein